MQYTEFKGKKISRLGFGTMRLPMDAEGKIVQETVNQMMDYALSHGVNYIDTAYKYHGGDSEIYTGRALARHPRESFYLADKMPTWLCQKSEDVKAIFEDQLSKCGVDYFDFYLVHNIDEETWPNIVNLEIVPLLLKEQAAGRIVHLGASFHCGTELFREILTRYGDVLEFVQLQLNYFDWEYEKMEEFYQIAREFDKPIIVMEPVRGGMLANPMSEEARRLLDDAASTPACKLPSGKGADYAAYALKFVDRLPGILTTLSGMSTPEQMEDNIRIFDAPAMSDAEHDAAIAAGRALQNDILVPCTACNYCDECPSGIKISEIFSMYNVAAAKGFHNIWSSLSGQYNALEKNAKDCIQCGACESHCPQKIKIIEELQKIDAKYAELEAKGE